ncbi:MAG: hypothetical protein ACKO6F_09740 [Cyanobium sp.]
MNRETEPQQQSAKTSQAPAAILAPVSLGELLNKITILEIKCDHFCGEPLRNARAELDQLKAALGTLSITPDPQLMEQLRSTYRKLWCIEDEIRGHELEQNFGASFIELARSVYQQNDFRSTIKRQLYLRHGSALMEEKSYTSY